MFIKSCKQLDTILMSLQFTGIYSAGLNPGGREERFDNYEVSITQDEKSGIPNYSPVFHKDLIYILFRFRPSELFYKL